MAQTRDRVPQCFWRTRYFAMEVMGGGDRDSRLAGSAWGDASRSGGEDAGEDLVIHDAADGEPWLWEIEHALSHPRHIAALEQIRHRSTVAA